MGSESPSNSGYGAMWATLDAKGKIEKAPARIPAAGEGAVSAIALEPSPAGIRTIVARGGDAIVLDALLLGQNAASPLVTLDGPPSLDVALVIHRGVLFFNDDGPNKEDKRARRARIDWTPGK